MATYNTPTGAPPEYLNYLQANNVNATTGNPAPTSPYNTSTGAPAGYTDYLVNNRFDQTTPGTAPGTTNEFIFPKGEDVKPYSGLPEGYRNQLLSFAMPQLEESVTNLPQNIDAYTENALSTYRQELDRSLKEMMPEQIGNLANRGILNSSMGENILSQTYSDAARKSAGMGYNTAMEAARMKTQIPQTVGQLLQYGQYSEDPTVMYKTLAGLLANMMP
jgi:hypothetical protein